MSKESQVSSSPLERHLRFLITEDNSWCSSIDYNIRDEFGQVILNVDSNQSLCGSEETTVANLNGDQLFSYVFKSGFFCSTNRLEVSNEKGTVLGTIKEGGSCWNSFYEVENSNRDEVFKISEPSCSCSCSCSENGYEIYSVKEESEIGSIRFETKAASCCFPKSQTELNLSREVEPASKALLISSCFLLMRIAHQGQNAAAGH